MKSDHRDPELGDDGDLPASGNPSHDTTFSSAFHAPIWKNFSSCPGALIYIPGGLPSVSCPPWAFGDVLDPANPEAVAAIGCLDTPLALVC